LSSARPAIYAKTLFEDVVFCRAMFSVGGVGILEIVSRKGSDDSEVTQEAQQ
jgi:hypothetical protein